MIRMSRLDVRRVSSVSGESHYSSVPEEMYGDLATVTRQRPLRAPVRFDLNHSERVQYRRVSQDSIESASGGVGAGDKQALTPPVNTRRVSTRIKQQQQQREKNKQQPDGAKGNNRKISRADSRLDPHQRFMNRSMSRVDMGRHGDRDMRDRKHSWWAIKSQALAAAVLPAYYRSLVKRAQSTEALNNGRINTAQVIQLTRGISLIRAARDGLMDVVEGHLALEHSRLNDTDEDGLTAMHHAARYNRVNVLERLVEAGGDVNIKSLQDSVRPLHLACRYNATNAVTFLLTQRAHVNIRDIKGRTPLHYATRRGHDKTSKILLSVSTCNVNAADADYTTPLHMAAIQGSANIVEMLITRRAEIDALDINDMTPLMWAAIEGHTGVTTVLLKAAEKQLGTVDYYVRAQDNEGNAALHLAVQNGQIEVAELLIENCADVNCPKFVKGGTASKFMMNMQTPLHLAAIHGYLDTAQLLVQSGADVNQPDSDHMSPVHRAALYNKVDVIRLLAGNGADLNAKDKKNKSPLHCACWKGQTETAQYLIDQNAQVGEADSSLMTALHWAVKSGNYSTMIVLLKHCSSDLLDATDKNDQSVLHYAAQTGNVLVMRTLLEHGARTDVKDQEERTPLHLAAMCDNVACCETLLNVSNHETNDDDADGRTPLILASSHGNHQVVQVLLSLGADITNRDDEHRTALMLSAEEGHTLVMKILLDNHAPVNELDKLKNSALHYACSGGHVEAVQMLLDKKADVAVRNTHDQSPLDQAIDHFHNEVALAMLRHKTWKMNLEVRDKHGLSAFDRLIAKLPEAAALVLDHCVERSTIDDTDVNLTMTLNFNFVDPGPDDVSYDKRRYFALNTMVRHGRDQLLSHPICQSILSQKWHRYGRTTFYTTVLLYLSYLFCLTAYTSIIGETYSALFEQRNLTSCQDIKANLSNGGMDIHRVPVNLTIRFGEYDFQIDNSTLNAVSWFLLAFITFVLLKEVFKIFTQGWKYFFNFFNWISLILVAATFAFVTPSERTPCLFQWRAGWIAHFLAWINFIMYLRRIDFVGIYVIMFVAVLISLLKAVLVYLFFCWAFAGSFFILMSRTAVFHHLGTAVLNIFVMTLGEIEFGDNFVAESLGAFETDVYILLFIFLFLMPIVLMNLMIGIAVGDIDKIQRNAYLKRIALQVELMYSFENNMPLWLQRRAYIRQSVIKPNVRKYACWNRFKTAIFGTSRTMQFIKVQANDKMMDTVANLQRDSKAQHQRLRNLQLTLDQQRALLEQIGAKLRVEGAKDNTSGGAMGLDVASFYDNITMYSALDTPMDRTDRTGRRESLFS